MPGYGIFLEISEVKSETFFPGERQAATRQIDVVRHVWVKQEGKLIDLAEQLIVEQRERLQIEEALLYQKQLHRQALVKSALEKLSPEELAEIRLTLRSSV